MNMRSLLMVGALLLGGCSINPYGGTPAPVTEPDQPVIQPEKPVTKPDAGAPLPKPVAPTGLALAMADAFVQAPEVRELAQSGNAVLLLTPPRDGTNDELDTSTMAAAMSKRIQSKSGFRFVDPGKVAAITGQLEYQQGRMNPASLVRLGRQTGASYM
ncbi:TPA: penicillin-binding protein activator LpoB, partial [Aeromonas salmonicida]|nr:penicillin-binding protein activator LpoB [Aeromonas salmonicida]